LEKIDIFPHILPRKYNEALLKRAKPCYQLEVNSLRPALTDLDIRFRVMDKFDGLRQVMTLGSPPLEYVLSPKDAMELARIANDEMAELVSKYPDRFVGAAASLPLNDVDGSLRETERTVKELKFKGIQIFSSINGKPLDRPEFLPLYEMMSQYDLPIIIHPMRKVTHPDYLTEKESKYLTFSLFGWPYDTTSAMARLVHSGIMEKYPNLRIVTHHCGGMVPFYAERIRQFTQLLDRRAEKGQKLLKKEAIYYYKMFYADTAIYGNPSALMCGYTFFGADHLVFGVDFPLGDIENGDRNYRQTINAIEQMDISDADRKKIYEDNARNLMRLPI